MAAAARKFYPFYRGITFVTGVPSSLVDPVKILILSAPTKGIPVLPDSIPFTFYGFIEDAFYCPVKHS